MNGIQAGAASATPVILSGMADDKNVDAVLRILKLVADAGQAQSIDTIAQKAAVNTDVARRLLSRLVSAGYVLALADSRFDIGSVALGLGANYRLTVRPSVIISSVLQRLVEDCMESATFFIADGDERVCIDRVDAKTALRDYVQIGTRLPLALGAGGHVLLAFNGAIGESYDRVRKDFLATSVGQLEADEASVAAPVFAPNDRLFGAIVVSGASDHFTPAAMVRLQSLLLKYAADLTIRLGGSANGFPRMN